VAFFFVSLMVVVMVAALSPREQRIPLILLTLAILVVLAIVWIVIRMPRGRIAQLFGAHPSGPPPQAGPSSAPPQQMSPPPGPAPAAPTSNQPAASRPPAPAPAVPPPTAPAPVRPQPGPRVGLPAVEQIAPPNVTAKPVRTSAPPAAPKILQPTVTPLAFGADAAALERDRILLRPLAIIGAQDTAGYFGGGVPHTPIEVRAAGLPGNTHLVQRAAGQDAVGMAWSEQRGVLYLAVADGVSSRPESGHAALGAVFAALRDLGSDTTATSLDRAVERARDAVIASNTRSELDGATTLVLAEVTPTAAGVQLQLATIGDSEVWTLHSGRWTPLARNRQGNRTASLPADQPTKLPTTELPRGTVLVLATDGFATALGDGNSALAAELARRWITAPALLEFVNHVDFRDLGYRDDRAVAAVWI
jgi:hypothetical protein